MRRAAPRLSMALVALQLLTAGALAVLLQGGRMVVARLNDGSSGTAGLALPVLLVALALFVSGVIGALNRELQQLTSERLDRLVDREVTAVAVSVPFPVFESAEFHDLLERTSARSANSVFRLVIGITALIETTAMSIAIAAVLLASVPQLLPALVVVSAPIMLASKASARFAYDTAYSLAPDDRRRRSIRQALVGKPTAREVRVLQLAPPLRARWEELYDLRLARIGRLAWRRGAWLTIANALSALVAGVVLWKLARATLRRDIELADTAVAVVGFQQLLQRLRLAAVSAGTLREAALFLDDYRELAGQGRELHDADSKAIDLSTGIAVDDVHFTYPGTEREVLRGVSFHVDRGEIVAIVGSSGAGKSSLVHLIAGLYEPNRGAITWDGRPLASIARPRLWRSLSVVFQDFGRFELTARENIAFGDVHSHAPVEWAAERAGIAEEIDRLANKYETVLSRQFGGAELSVGQWQRLAVARALYRAAPLLVLDEPSASLDAEAEALLVAELRRDAAERATVIVSHRFSTVARADRIVVLEAGAVVEQGSHRELMAQGGRYAQLFELQQV